MGSKPRKQPVVDYTKYVYCFDWAGELGIRARCLELELTTYGDNHEEAFERITDLARARVNEGDAPEPLALRIFSGKFVTRVSPQLHRKLAIEAANQGISMNRYIEELLCK